MFKRLFMIFLGTIHIGELKLKIQVARVKIFFRKLVLFKCMMVNQWRRLTIKKWYENPEKYKKQIIELSIMEINQMLPPEKYEIKYNKFIKMMHIIHKKEGYEVFVSPDVTRPFVSEITNFDERLLYLIENIHSDITNMERVMKLAGDKTNKYLKVVSMCRGANLIRSNLNLYAFDEIVEYLGVFYDIKEIEYEE